MSGNWRNESDYEYIEELDAAGLAWECLRRNSRYCAAFPKMSKREALTWGLRFPGRSRARRDRSDRSLDARPCSRNSLRNRRTT